MTAGMVWLADAIGLMLVAVVAYHFNMRLFHQAFIGRRIRLASGGHGETRRTVNVAAGTAGLLSKLSGVLAIGGRLLPLGDEDRRKMAISLQRAGFNSPNAVGTMLGIKFTSLLGGFLAGGFAAVAYLSGLMAVLGGLVGGLLTGVMLNVFPELILNRLAGNRIWRMNAGLPDTFDLLVICLESGLTFDRALQRTVDNLGSLHPDLEAEFSQVLLDVNVHGRTRGEALGRLADRLESQNFRDLAITVDQSERHGTPLADSLRRLASSIRVESVARVKEKMGRLPTLLVVPSIAGILPGILVIVGGPAFRKLSENMSSFGGG
ncbi:MAG: type II secretion system F family protein [Gammaproteobacteria bacterium]|nr:type II secretion system F family protein [Gammaproteobacteria bacterium]MDE0269997.1 type II secretion system F family protein [Gammaproteobacteria bacterium]